MSSSSPTTLVYLWWMKLCDFFQCTLGEVVSHSHSVEWISGSFIQSHWPWMMLWPSSMFSMIFADASIAIPAARATLLLAGEQRDPATRGEAPLQLDGPTDVAGVALSAGVLDVGSDRIEFVGEGLDVVGREVCVFLDVSDSHCLSFRS